MERALREEYEQTVKKRDEVREHLRKLEAEKPKDHYNITITRDRLAYWEGKTEGLKFALDRLSAKEP
ncbi:MAG: hypothetical protein JSU90_12460 [Nitrospiraceae bacterium]|nr:MAG: hypothetical protein JSU90_12460 [Nitrospiraceae bacterium]